MSNIKNDLIRQYYQKIKGASKELTKKEIFKDLLHRLYPDDKEIAKIIDAISCGSEATILNIPRKDKIHRGSADTLYNNIIIEFENDLRVTLKHAKEQLAGYLLGKYNSGDGYRYTLIASDFITWKVFAPDVSCLDKLDSLNEDELVLNEVPSASFVLNEKNAEDFYYWIDRFLFKEEKQKATLKSIEESFGYQSNTFIDCYKQISDVFHEAKKYGEVQVSHEQWRKFLSIAYGSFDGKGNDFVIHTYLSIFAKMLAYAVVSNDDYIDEEETKEILDGSIFNRYNIENFVDNDFFHWVKTDRNFKALKKVFRLIAQEISTFDFENVDEDILKGVYQELIDLDTRHSLGEYYTPDWLCERIVQEFEFKKTDKILDPSCGSGSFLRAAIHRLRELHPKISAEELNNSVYGIDIHPLSVQIAKTTMLVALGKDVTKSKRPIHINIILANTLLAPEGIKNLFGGEFLLYIDKERLFLTTQILDDVVLFDEAIDVAEELAEQTINKKKESIKTFENTLSRKHKGGGISTQMYESFYQIYEGLKDVKEKGRDSIWKFIIQNLYKPYFLSEKFDYVIGNPPWFTYKDVKNEDYQKQLNLLGDKYNIKTKKKGTFAHLEIAAIFLAYCTNYFLKKDGKLAFVLPRSFFDGKQHDHTRSGDVSGIKVTQIWDLINVKPLFHINSCVLFTERAAVRKSLPSTGLSGISFIGNLPHNNCNYSVAKESLSEEKTSWFYRKQGASSAYTNSKGKNSLKINPYRDEFQAGATLRPRMFSFVDLTQEYPSDFHDRIISIKTADSIQVDAKKPWKGLILKGKIESQFIFQTVLANSIVPFAFINPYLIVLPVLIDSKNKSIKTCEPSDLRKEGFLNAAKWFQDCENIWNINRTDLNQQYTVSQYLNYQNKIVVQNLNKRYLVLYNASAKDANSVVIDRDDFQTEFIVDHVTYWFATDVLEEAHYLSSILNSTTPNQMMKDFQAKGLFGARHVHKKILDIYFPAFNSENTTHIELSALSKKSHILLLNHFKENPVNSDLRTFELGRLRIKVKEIIEKEMKEIDKLVKKIIG